MRKLITILLKTAVYISAFITVFITVFLIGYILIKGLPHMKLSLFEWKYTTTNVSLMPALVGTFLMILLTLLVAVPVGVFSAIWLHEYAAAGSAAKSKRLKQITDLFVKTIRLATETLAGIPSTVYGLFGMLFFVIYLKFGYSLLAGVLTLSIMVLPLIMRTTEEALMSVPVSYREGSFALGAGRLRTIFRVVLPSASYGILSGVLLAIGRIVGESAALIFTAGTVASIPKSLFSSIRTLSVHMYSLSSEGLFINESYATAVVLLIFVIIINAISTFIARKVEREKV